MSYSDDLKFYAENIKHNTLYLRTVNGWSQSFLAKKLHIETPNISSYELGKSTPSLETVVKLITVFRVTSDAFLFTKITDSEAVNDPQESYYTLPNANLILDEMDEVKNHISKVEKMIVTLKNKHTDES